MSEIPKIARARLAAGPDAVGGSHPDADQMTAFLERSLGAREREQVLEHLARCSECREVAALAPPPEEAERVAEPASGFLGFQWQTLRWAAVAATFVIAVTLVFQSYRETPEKFAARTEPNPPVEATAPAEKPATTPAAATGEATKQAEAAPAATEPAPAAGADQAAHAYRAQPAVPGGAAGKEKTAGSSTVAVLRDQESGAANGPSKLDGVSRAKTAAKSGEVAAGGVGGVVGGRVGYGVGPGSGGGRVDDLKKMSGEAKAETGGGTVAARTAAAAPAPAMAQSRREPSPPAPQQQVAGLAQPEPLSPPAAKEEVREERAAGEPASRAAADQSEAGRVASQNEVVNVESMEKDADKVRKTSVAASTRWVITAQGLVQRSRDEGSSWKGVRLPSGIRFRAVSANDAEVWAGGEGGALYHSSDSGDTWTRVALPAELASATIVRVEFTGAQRGTLATSAGEIWTTGDGGTTWRKQ